MKKSYHFFILALVMLVLIFSGCSEEDLGDIVNPKDVTAPVVTIVSPTEGTTVTGDFNIIANVVDEESIIAFIAIALDGVVIDNTKDGSVVTSELVDYSSLVASTMYTILITASNNSGLVSTNEFHFYTAGTNVVTNDTVAPIVSIVSPTDGSTVSGDFTISVNGNDVDGIVDRVKVSVDGSLFETISNQASGSYVTSSYSIGSWNDGVHVVTVVGYDDSGNSVTNSISVIYTNATIEANLVFNLGPVAGDPGISNAQFQTVQTNRPTLHWNSYFGVTSYAVSVWNLALSECYFLVEYDSSVTSIQYGDETGSTMVFQSANPLTLSDNTYVINVVGKIDGVDEAIAHLKAVIDTSGGSKSIATKSVIRSFITREQYDQMLLDYYKSKF